MDIPKFISDQLSVWPLTAANFRSLKTMSVRDVTVGGLDAKVQFNPCRIASSTAEIDEKTISARKCFLCVSGRPPEQFHLKFEGRKGRNYNIQVNPYPVFPGHLVIAREKHVPQSIWHHMPDMLEFAGQYADYIVYYNGPFSGASAPEHLHFQACPLGSLPLQTAVDSYLDCPEESVASVQDASVYHFKSFTRGVYCFSSVTSKSLTKMFYRFLECSPCREGEPEPRFNLYVWYKTGSDKPFRAFAVLRTEIRSHHYFADGPEHLTISPGAAEMAGVFIAPVEEDYCKVTASQLEEMLAEVSIGEEDEKTVEWRLTRSQLHIDVGVMSADSIRFEIISDGAGAQEVRLSEDGRIDYNGAVYDELYFDAVTRSTLFAEPSFILYDVPIGIDFHWQRKQDQKFAGRLKFIVEDGKVTAVNTVGMEDYLLSVISSEMNPDSPLELLKAHAVISRSWAVARIGDRKDSPEGFILPHTLFDVCADDHCQRYQGIPEVVPDNVRRAVDETWGQVLRYDGRLCDTRFSKCCGGRSEIFSTCWEDVDHPYLQSVEDPFCDCHDPEILSLVLKDYDLETADFHDWKVSYTRDELSELVRLRTGMDFGTVLALEPLERGASGRIKYLRIVGSLRTEVIGKELAIRRALSTSHLKSSDFTVEVDGDVFTLTGRGWGHGVGLCQIGAAVMACRGYGYIEILKHYYTGASVE